MPKLNLNLFLDEDYEVYADRQYRRRTKYKAGHTPKRFPADVKAELAEGGETSEIFDFSYKASRHERTWIVNSLGGFYEQHWFDDLLRLVKGGKEASVYQCLGNQTTGSDYIAAKIYRPRMFRNLRKDHIYREGRANLDSDGNVIEEDGMLNAMRKRSTYGLELLHTSWLAHELKALQVLSEAGADVPIPYASNDNAILMEYVGGEFLAAPTLIEVDLEQDEAHALFEQVLKNIEILLANNMIHADLSAYNILYWEGQIKLIDFPQVIHPDENRNAYRIFERDVTKVCEYFARQGVKNKPREIATKMWRASNRRIDPEIHPAHLDEEDAKDRAYWEQSSNKTHPKFNV